MLERENWPYFCFPKTNTEIYDQIFNIKAEEVSILVALKFLHSIMQINKELQ